MSYQDIFYNSIPFDLNIAFSDKVSIDAVIDELLPKIKLPPKDNNKHLLKVLLLTLTTDLVLLMRYSVALIHQCLTSINMLQFNGLL